jgi:hypothetical protein
MQIRGNRYASACIAKDFEIMKKFLTTDRLSVLEQRMASGQRAGR